jgi:DNA-binding NarL/FixJ family response regulator
MTDIRVLIVDDVEQVRQDLRTVLMLSGEMEIIGEAANGVEAIRLAESLQPDVVLMDLEMPVLDGYEATRQIKSHFPSCNVVALTIHGYDQARLKAYESGVDEFIIKGAPVQAIVEAILKKKE